MKDDNSFIVTEIGHPARWLVEAAAGIGLDIAGLTHEITSHFKNHSLNRHGSVKVHGPAAITEADFGRIPAILAAPDMAVVGAVRGEALCNAYAKGMSGATFLYFEDVLDSRRNKSLRGRTLYRVNKALSDDEFIKIVTMNNKTDVSKAKIIAAGGHPGGEAE